MRQGVDYPKLLIVLCAALLVTCSEQQAAKPRQQAAPAATGAVASTTDGATTVAAPLPGLGTATYRERTDISAQELGLPLYPGATPLTGGTWRMTDVLSEGAESLTSLRLHTTDALEKVAGFYRTRLQPGPQQSFEFEGATGKGISLTTQTSDHASLNVVLRQQSMGTRIDISVMGLRQNEQFNPHPD